MKLLLDTHTFMWWDSNPANLSPPALIHTLDDGVRFRRAGLQDRSNFLAGNRTEPASVCMTALRDPANTKWISVVSIWEMVIKSQLGKLTLHLPLSQIVAHQQANGLQVLSVSLAHVLAVEGLPAVHKDPFDRLLVAQANVEAAEFVTADPVFARYPVRILW